MFAEPTKLLMELSTDWSESDLEAKFSRQGLRLSQRVGARRTFEDRSRRRYSAYLNRDARVSFIEVNLEVFVEPGSLAPDLYISKLAEYREKFALGLVEMTDVLGQPDFVGTTSDPGFPPDQNAVVLAQWRRGQMRCMLQLKHDDKETPIRLAVVLVPHAQA